MVKEQLSTVKVPKEFQDLVQPHVDSFDWFVSEGMQLVLQNLEPLEIAHPVSGQTLRLWFENATLGRPSKEDTNVSDQRLLPRDCREAGITYKAAFSMDMCYQAGGLPLQRISRRMGSMPVMVKSRACHLRHMTRAELVAVKEESTEMGGYFICNGIERIIRLLIQQRRHYIMALKRGSYHKRGSNFTDLATMLRCVRIDERSDSIRCHYLTDGTVTVALTIRRAEYFIPAGLLLKCFVEVTDRELFQRLVQAAIVESDSDAAFVADRAELLLKHATRFGLKTRAQCVEYLGSHFRTELGALARKSDYQVGLQLLRQCIFQHLDNPHQKLDILLAMLQKLYALVAGQCSPDDPDALTSHEVLLPGQLLCKFLQERLNDSLEAFKAAVLKELGKNAAAVSFQDDSFIARMAQRMMDIGPKMEYLLNTGNLTSKGGADLSQTSGFTVVAEKLNFYRYLSHFRSIHRGAFFMELRTTAVRKLLPESWGFLCPVHTPDGSPCGLLNHLSAACRIVTQPPDLPDAVRQAIAQVLAELGMTPAEPTVAPPPMLSHVPVQLDGRVIGHVSTELAEPVMARLHALKAAALARQEPATDISSDLPPLQGPETLVPAHMEVSYIPFLRGGTYPGIFIFTNLARFVRPVLHLATNSPELLGTLEQHNLNVRCPDGGVGGTPGLRFTHAEFGPGSMLSVVASLTPYSDFNQSPRNMYQCQMGKQTMGTPAQALPQRTDTKLYRIQTPQTPIARTAAYARYHIDEFPNGTNMIVAVLAYTGYDMEDAMILNKSGVDRGLAHATVIKSEVVDLRDERGKEMMFMAEKAGPRDWYEAPVSALGQRFPQNIPACEGGEALLKQRIIPQGRQRNADRVDVDGLPHVGAVVYPKQGYYSKLDKDSRRVKVGELKGEEVAVIDQVTIIGGKEPELKRANIRARYNRNPVIGDKFSSRHGQKGVLSQQWKDVDMPFCASTGMRPDLIINPHAFPSRMTIGMLIESLVSKAGALTGKFVDATPFQKSAGREGDHISRVAEELEAHGFHRHGGECMISGVTGEEFAAEIFIGPVYYQRLRHMVSDKFQVRSSGSVNPLTRQPIKGRKFGGGIRFGEMERDALLAHGAAYLVHDRLHNCSDYHVMDICASCGSLLSPQQCRTTKQGQQTLHLSAVDNDGRTPTEVICRVCETGKHVRRVALPYVFRFLVTELAAMNIKCKLGVA